MRPAQYFLPMKDLDRALLMGVRVRAALRVFGKDVGYKRLADLWGCDESTVSLKIEEKGRHYVKPHELLAAMAIDNSGVILATVCAELGYEMPERVQEPASEAERLLAAAAELFSPDVLELLRRKAGV